MPDGYGNINKGPGGYTGPDQISGPPEIPYPGTSPGYGTPTPGMDEHDYLNSDPDAAFFRYLQGAGYTDPGVVNTSFGKYAQAQQDRVYKGYKSWAATDPNQGFYDYLQNQHPDLHTDFMNQSPEQRGDFSSRIMTPRARWAG